MTNLLTDNANVSIFRTPNHTLLPEKNLKKKELCKMMKFAIPHAHFNDAALPADTLLVQTMCAVYNARTPARAAMDNNRLAHDFITAAQHYQVELRYAYLGSPAASPFRHAYEASLRRSPMPVKGAVPDLLKNRVEAELALVQGRAEAINRLDRMVESGCRYMRTCPDLALTLDLPLPEKIWNQVKRGCGL